MGTIHEIELLPVNSFELETHISELGLSLVDFARQRNFSKECLGVEDCDFIQSVVVEFMSELKTDFIAFLGVAQSSVAPGSPVKIQAIQLPGFVVEEAALNADERGFKVVSPSVGVTAKLKRIGTKSLLHTKDFLYEKKIRWNNSRMPRQSIPHVATQQRRILLSTFQANTIYTLVPIQEALSKRADVFQAYLTNRIETYRLLQSLGYQNLMYGWALSHEQVIRVDHEVLIDFVDDFFEQAFRFGATTSQFKKSFLRKLTQKLEFAAALYGPIKRIMTEFNPHVVLVSSASTVDAQILVHLCRSMGIKFFEMTHGMFQDTPILRYQNVPVKLVWNRHQYDLMKKYRPEVNCRVIGNPKHDSIVSNFRKAAPKRVYTQPYVLLISTPGNNISISRITYLQILSDFIETARSIPELQFVFRLHPSEDLAKISADAVQFSPPPNFVIDNTNNTYEMLYHTEMVVVSTSTVGYEALLFDKAIICYSIPNSDKWMPLGQFGLAKNAADAETLIAAVRDIMKHPVSYAGNEKKAYFVHSDGKAVESAVETILDQE